MLQSGEMRLFVCAICLAPGAALRQASSGWCSPDVQNLNLSIIFNYHYPNCGNLGLEMLRFDPIHWSEKRFSSALLLLVWC